MLFSGIGLSQKDSDMIHKKIPIERIKRYVSWMKWKKMYLFPELYKAVAVWHAPIGRTDSLHFPNILVTIPERTNWVNQYGSFTL